MGPLRETSHILRGPSNSRGQAAHEGRSAADRGEYRQVAGVRLILISLKAALHRWDSFLRFDQSFQLKEIRDVVVFVERRALLVEHIHYALFAICSDFRLGFFSI